MCCLVRAIEFRDVLQDTTSHWHRETNASYKDATLMSYFFIIYVKLIRMMICVGGS